MFLNKINILSKLKNSQFETYLYNTFVTSESNYRCRSVTELIAQFIYFHINRFIYILCNVNL